MPTIVPADISLGVAVTSDQDKLSERNVQSIYKSCLDLFQAKNITTNNAFRCKLLDCLPQLIESPDFDITNMQVVGRTLEMGTKIYVCRVDDTYQMVMSLAKRIGVKGKTMERLREVEEQQRQADEDGEGAMDADLGDNELDANGEPLFAKERKTTKKKRRGNFLASKDKIRMVFPEKVEKYADRQTRMRDMFNRMKETRQVGQERFGNGRDTMSGTKDTEEAISTAQKFPEVFCRSEFGAKVQFLQFVFLPHDVVFDRELYDPWGRSKQALASAEEERQSALNATKTGSQSGLEAGVNNDQLGSADGEYHFDVNAEVDYGDDAVVDAEHFGYNGDDSDKEEEAQAPRITDLGQVRNMTQLAEFYEALRTMGANKKLAMGWAGPNFLRNRLGSSRTVTGNSERKPRTKKVVAPFVLGKVNWKDPIHHYDALVPGRLELDDKCLERWKLTKQQCHGAGVRSTDAFNEDTYLDLLTGNSNVPQDVEKFLRYFVDPKWNILQMFGDNGNRDQSFDRSLDGDGLDDDGDIDFEGGARSQFEEGGDYCSNSLLGAELGGEPGLQIPSSGNMNLDTFLSFFPTLTFVENTDYEDFMGATADSDGIKFAKQPKPINMRLLKYNILKILRQKLELDENNKSTQDKDMSLDILTLLLEVFRRSDERTARFLSTSLLFLALLHVAAEIGVFLERTDGPLENINIIARAKGWNHRLHIPMALPDCERDEEPTSTRQPSLPAPPSDHNGVEESNGHDDMELDMVHRIEETVGSTGSTQKNNEVSMET